MVDVFLSVGRTFTTEQEQFVSTLLETLRAEGLNPRALNRTEFTSATPLEAIRECMQQCKGTIVVAFERVFIESGFELRGSASIAPIKKQSLTTVWNHLEGGIAVALGHPLLVIAEQGLKSEGLVENSNGWFVQWIPIEASALGTPSFRGVLTHWKKTLGTKSAAIVKSEELTIDQVIRGMKVSTLWGLLAALAGLIVFTAGFAYWIGTHNTTVNVASSQTVGVGIPKNFDSVGQGQTPLHLDFTSIATERLRKLTFVAANTKDGFVMNGEVDLIGNKSVWDNQGAPTSVEETNQKSIQNEFLTVGPGTVRTALEDSAGPGYRLVRIDCRIIFDNMGALEMVQVIEGYALGPDGQEHRIGRPW